MINFQTFLCYSVTLDENTNIIDTVQLAVMSMVLSTRSSNAWLDHCSGDIPQLCDVILEAGLPWKMLAGLTTNRAPSVTGRRNGLVNHVQRNLEEEGEETIALRRVIYQQSLCSKCLKFDTVTVCLSL